MAIVHYYARAGRIARLLLLVPRALPIGLVVCSMVAQVGCLGPVTSREYKASDVPTEFLLGSEDQIEINVWKNPDLSRVTLIRPDGYVSMPIIGDIQAAGLTADALAAQITERLKGYIQNPSVSVNVKELNSYSVFVLGEVTKPGKYQLKSYVTVLQAISMAGGFTNYASKNRLQVVRVIESPGHKRQEIHIPLRYDDLVSGRGEPGNIVLASGDTLVVP
jgi:polysaccharide export outer membrane protein